jgi:hypothetical protein
MISGGGLVTMTPKQLIDKAAKSGGWEFDQDNRIRRWHDLVWECPLTAVANELLPSDKKFTVAQWQEAADLLGLPFEDACAVVYAADADDDFQLRKLMLTKFGLRF